MEISTHDEVPKDLTPLKEKLLLIKKRDEMLRRVDKEAEEIYEGIENE